jgi:D-ribose pyranase
MKRGGILHPDISHLLASTGHTDYFLISDRGFPVPPEPERIDLALVDDLPTVVDVLRAVHEEFVIDRIVIAEEMMRFSADRAGELRELLGDITVELVSHIELKRLSHDARATIRTGDTTPYANLIVVSG